MDSRPRPSLRPAPRPRRPTGCAARPTARARPDRPPYRGDADSAPRRSAPNLRTFLKSMSFETTFVTRARQRGLRADLPDRFLPQILRHSLAHIRQIVAKAAV